MAIPERATSSLFFFRVKEAYIPSAAEAPSSFDKCMRFTLAPPTAAPFFFLSKLPVGVTRIALALEGFLGAMTSLALLVGLASLFIEVVISGAVTSSAEEGSAVTSFFLPLLLLSNVLPGEMEPSALKTTLATFFLSRLPKLE